MLSEFYKERFEEWLWHIARIMIQHYHSDSGELRQLNGRNVAEGEGGHNNLWCCWSTPEWNYGESNSDNICYI